MTKQTKLTNEEREDHALGVLFRHLQEARGEEWTGERVPTGKKPSFDFILTEQESNRMAALEITSFEWPTNSARLRNNLHRLAGRIQDTHGDRVTGIFTLSANINAIDEGRLFRGKGRKERQAILDIWFAHEASQFPLGKLTRVPDLPGISVLRHTSDGPLNVRVPVTSARTRYPNWMLDLELVIADNVPKFDGVVDIPRWLLVTYPGIEGKLEITGPVLSVPAEIDELFFVDQEGINEDWPPRNTETRYWIVDYSEIGPVNHHYDRETGAVKVAVPVRIDQEGETADA